MKTKLKWLQIGLLGAVALGLNPAVALAAAAADSTDPAKTAIPWSQIGAKAGAEYQGNGLSVIPTAGGARLRCVFQRLEGEATDEGLWLTSTFTNAASDRFRVTATEVGRVTPCAPGAANIQHSTFNTQLETVGNISLASQTVRFSRPGLTEEYTVSMDGVRQDFIIEHPPLNSQLSTLNERTGELAVRLAVSGAKVEPLADGAQLVLENSGRKIAYSRLRVTDATGKELTARMEVEAASDLAATRQSAGVVEREHGDGLPARRYTQLAVLVKDADAVYPVRIDPTFSDANWMSMGGFHGVGVVNATAVDGAGNLYIGGSLLTTGEVLANRIAMWNGSNWSVLGSGLNNDVYALAVSGNNLYVGGAFTTAGGSAANRIARWNGSSWSALGLGFNNTVYALAVSGSDLYAGGVFTTAGGFLANRIAKWNGNSWTALGSGLNNNVYALAVSSNNVYSGGSFTTAGSSPANYIGIWNGNGWSSVGSGMNSMVRALAMSGSDLYVGGDFTAATNSDLAAVSANRIAKWDGSSWSVLGAGMDSWVGALAVSGGDVFAGGRFSTAGGNEANSIAKWDGTNWTALGLGMSYDVLALAVSGSDLFAGGRFSTAGDKDALGIAKWSGSNWTALHSGRLSLNDRVTALVVSGSEVYAGGLFTTAGGNTANRIGKWNGSSWTALGLGMNSNVWALAASGSDVYAAGQFTRATNSGGIAVTVEHIAKWDGSNWTALGSGLGGAGPPYVSALAASGSDVYAGGNFTTAGGSPAYYIAKWNGSSWATLGSGMNNYVYALAVSGSDVYAGGNFATAGGNPASRIAKWDGSSWSALGSGVNAAVRALVVSVGDVYAGGDFIRATNSGGVAVTANCIAKWNGSSWSALGSGLGGAGSPWVAALVVSGSNVYAGGSFTAAGGNTANYIAKWNGNSWTALGSGMSSSYVSALAVTGSDLYVGGNFAMAGGKVSPYIARAYMPTLPVLSVLRSGAEVTVSWPSVDTDGFGLEQADMLVPPANWVTNSAIVTNDGTNKFLTLSATNSPQFFRLRRP